MPLVLTTDPRRPWEIQVEGGAVYVRRPWRGDSSRWEYFRTHGSEPYRFRDEVDAAHYMRLLEQRISRRTTRRPERPAQENRSA